MDHQTARSLHQINSASQACLKLSNKVIKATSENSENGVDIGPNEKYDVFNDILNLKIQVQLMETSWNNINAIEQKPVQPQKVERTLPHILAVK